MVDGRLETVFCGIGFKYSFKASMHLIHVRRHSCQRTPLNGRWRGPDPATSIPLSSSGLLAQRCCVELIAVDLTQHRLGQIGPGHITFGLQLVRVDRVETVQQQ